MMAADMPDPESEQLEQSALSLKTLYDAVANLLHPVATSEAYGPVINIDCLSSVITHEEKTLLNNLLDGRINPIHATIKLKSIMDNITHKLDENQDNALNCGPLVATLSDKILIEDISRFYSTNDDPTVQGLIAKANGNGPNKNAAALCLYLMFVLDRIHNMPILVTTAPSPRKQILRILARVAIVFLMVKATSYVNVKLGTPIGDHYVQRIGVALGLIIPHLLTPSSRAVYTRHLDRPGAGYTES